MDHEVSDLRPATGLRALGRRGAVAAGMAGMASLLVGRVARGAPPDDSADPPDASTGGTADDATASSPPPTSVAPSRPTDGDVELLAFAQAAELSARQLYADMLDAFADDPAIDDTRRVVFTAIREAHQGYANALSGLLGGSAAGGADQALIDELGPTFTAGVDEALLAAYDLESALVATHTELIGSLQGLDGVALIASILIVEARHGTVIADMLGLTSLDDLLVADERDALDPAVAP